MSIRTLGLVLTATLAVFGCTRGDSPPTEGNTIAPDRGSAGGGTRLGDGSPKKSAKSDQADDESKDKEWTPKPVQGVGGGPGDDSVDAGAVGSPTPAPGTKAKSSTKPPAKPGAKPSPSTAPSGWPWTPPGGFQWPAWPWGQQGAPDAGAQTTPPPPTAKPKPTAIPQPSTVPNLPWPAPSAAPSSAPAPQPTSAPTAAPAPTAPAPTSDWQSQP